MNNTYEIQKKLDSIKEEIRRDWLQHKRSLRILSDKDMKDNQLDMVLVFLIKQGFFDE